MSKLSTYEENFIKTNESFAVNIIQNLDIVRQFKEGDFLVAYYVERPHPIYTNESNQRRPVSNSYGVPKKFKVIAVDKVGVPYMKELNKNGNPVGRIIPAITYHMSNGRIETALSYDFQIDPSYADAIILDSVKDFDAVQVNKMKSNTFKEITAFNKSIKIKYSSGKELGAYLATLKAGDTIWRSNLTSWAITEINPIPRDKANRIVDHVIFMKVNTSKGKQLELCFKDIMYKAIYKDRPRTYGELKD